MIVGRFRVVLLALVMSALATTPVSAQEDSAEDPLSGVGDSKDAPRNLGPADYSIGAGFELEVMGDGGVDYLAQSSDGRIVVYETLATDPATGQKELHYVDRVAGSDEVIYTGSSISFTAVSGDGMTVAFLDRNRALVTWTSESGLVSRTSLGSPVMLQSPWLSADGRFVVFSARGALFVDGVLLGDSGGGYGTYRLDLSDNTGERVQWPGQVSVRTLGSSGSPLTADGRSVVVFGTNAASLPTEHTMGLYDFHSGSLNELVTAPFSGGEGIISPDGRSVFFQSLDPLFAEVPAGRSLYEFVTTSGELSWIGEGLPIHEQPIVSGNGRFVAASVPIGGSFGKETKVVVLDRVLGSVTDIPIQYPDDPADILLVPRGFTPDGAFLEIGAFECSTEGSICGFSRALFVSTGFGPTATLLWDADETPLADEVVRLYQASFGRVPESAGLSYWVRQRAQGLSSREMTEGFVGSPESTQAYGQDPSIETLVDLVYENVLGRRPDEAGRAFWVGRMNDGLSRVELLMAFAESPENIAGTGTSVPQDGESGELLRLYRAVFGRFPDFDGFRYWMAWQSQGRDLTDTATMFMNSTEFADRYGAEVSDQRFVELLYSNVLGRPADAAGAAHWRGQLESGVARVDVLIAFSDSPENIEATSTQP